MSELSILYVPVSSREEALNISRKVIFEKLAACVNLIPHILEFQKKYERMLTFIYLRRPALCVCVCVCVCVFVHNDIMISYIA